MLRRFLRQIFAFVPWVFLLAGGALGAYSVTSELAVKYKTEKKDEAGQWDFRISILSFEFRSFPIQANSAKDCEEQAGGLKQTWRQRFLIVFALIGAGAGVLVGGVLARVLSASLGFS